MLPVSELRLGSEERIARACELLAAGHKVVMLEDDPSLALRAAHAGVAVLMRAHPYNAGVQHVNIIRVAEFHPTVVRLALDMELE
jgi:hypothetical protein